LIALRLEYHQAHQRFLLSRKSLHFGKQPFGLLAIGGRRSRFFDLETG